MSVSQAWSFSTQDMGMIGCQMARSVTLYQLVPQNFWSFGVFVFVDTLWCGGLEGIRLGFTFWLCNLTSCKFPNESVVF